MSQRYPHPGCFVKRVWICLIIKELTFLATTKSPQEYETAWLRPHGWLQNLSDGGYTQGCREKEGGNGDTVSRTLTKRYRIAAYLSSDKLRRLLAHRDVRSLLAHDLSGSSILSFFRRCGGGEGAPGPAVYCKPPLKADISCPNSADMSCAHDSEKLKTVD
jgi:hypothetical protein